MNLWCLNLPRSGLNENCLCLLIFHFRLISAPDNLSSTPYYRIDCWGLYVGSQCPKPVEMLNSYVGCWVFVVCFQIWWKIFLNCYSILKPNCLLWTFSSTCADPFDLSTIFCLLSERCFLLTPSSVLKRHERCSCYCFSSNFVFSLDIRYFLDSYSYFSKGKYFHSKGAIGDWLLGRIAGKLEFISPKLSDLAIVFCLSTIINESEGSAYYWENHCSGLDFCIRYYFLLTGEPHQNINQIQGYVMNLSYWIPFQLF